uniref:Large ribosomal subunit protein bL33c n=1 Tax=Oryza meridionalis TaxID=40149 RepID=A0A0E0DTU1_9ORYZ
MGQAGPLAEEASPSTAPFSLALLLCRRVRRRLALSSPARRRCVLPASHRADCVASTEITASGSRLLLLLRRWVPARPCPPPLADKAAGTGFFYVKRKNPRRITEKLEFRKYDPRLAQIKACNPESK